MTPPRGWIGYLIVYNAELTIEHYKEFNFDLFSNSNCSLLFKFITELIKNITTHYDEFIHCQENSEIDNHFALGIITELLDIQARIIRTQVRLQQES